MPAADQVLTTSWKIWTVNHLIYLKVRVQLATSGSKAAKAVSDWPLAVKLPALAAQPIAWP